LAYSAGTEPSAVHPLAVKVMGEIGIDISTYRSKHVREFLGKDIYLVVTVCDNARESCPFSPAPRRLSTKASLTRLPLLAAKKQN
jgi:arsenate reductase